MSIGWFDDLADAEDYFENERLETDAWDALYLLDSAGLYNEKALLQAYNRLFYHPDYEFPTYADATAAELEILKKANGEMAYYLALHLSDEDRRKGLQAQGVVKAGIVKEDYLAEMLLDIPIPSAVVALIAPFLSAVHVILPADIERDEDQSAKKKVHHF
jgi:hypothetical protein